MNDADLKAYDEALATLTRLRGTLGPPIISIPSGADLQLAINNAVSGSVFQLAPDATYTVPGGLMVDRGIGFLGPAQIIGTGNAAVTVIGDGVSFARKITIRNPNPQGQLIGVTGRKFALDYCDVLGDPVNGQHRGLMLNGDGATITNSNILNCFLVGREAQAIAGWDGSRNILIDQCLLQGAAQSVLFGGADSTASDRIPMGITITNCELTKDPAWYKNGSLIKTAMELKSAVSVIVRNCHLAGAGIGAGQGAYAMVLTVRNQDGTAPWSTIQAVLFEDCIADSAGGAVNILGLDDVPGHASVKMSGVTFRRCQWVGLDASVYGGPGRGLQFLGAADRVTFDTCSIQGTHFGTSAYLIKPYPTQLVMSNVSLPPSTYGMKIDAGGHGIAAWQAAMPDAQFNTVVFPNGEIG